MTSCPHPGVSTSYPFCHTEDKSLLSYELLNVAEFQFSPQPPSNSCRTQNLIRLEMFLCAVHNSESLPHLLNANHFVSLDKNPNKNHSLQKGTYLKKGLDFI